MLTRIPPKMPPTAYKTYKMAAPPATHWRFASCREVDCDSYAYGWQTVIDLSADGGPTNAQYIRLHSGRAHTSTQAGDLVTFVFSPGQACFRCPPAELLGRDVQVRPQLAGRVHQVPLQREPVFAVVDGDWRGNPRGTRPQVLRPRVWLDDFGEHQDRLADMARRG